jgi:hypothetical protein
MRRFLTLLISLVLASGAMAQLRTDGVDTALVVAIDVSESVDAQRYKLQMEGVAQALENPEVVRAITSGQRAAILFAVVQWSDAPELTVPWQRIGSAEDARRVAAMVRALPHKGGEFTCLSRLFRYATDSLLPALPVPAARVIVDVSGDGIDNCNVRASIDEARDTLVASGATINGLPILVPGENDIVGEGAYRAPGFGFDRVGPGTDATTLEAYFTAHVIGGPGAFLLAAQGYSDFGRAIARKFVVEISMN